MSSSGVKYSIRFERLELLGEVKEEEMKEMRKLLAELHKKISEDLLLTRRREQTQIRAHEEDQASLDQTNR